MWPQEDNWARRWQMFLAKEKCKSIAHLQTPLVKSIYWLKSCARWELFRCARVRKKGRAGASKPYVSLMAKKYQCRRAASPSPSPAACSQSHRHSRWPIFAIESRRRGKKIGIRGECWLFVQPLSPISACAPRDLIKRARYKVFCYFVILQNALAAFGIYVNS